MKIQDVQVFHVDAGWRPWSFIKITTNDSLIGWSECTDSHGSPSGIGGVIQDLKPLLIDENPNNINQLLWKLHSRTRQSPGSIIQKAIGGIENALWDIRAKVLNVPVYELFGGKVRDEIPLYWSHCATTRIRAADITNTSQIRNIEDLNIFGAEVKKSGFTAVKSNLAVFEKDPYIYMPGFFKSRGGPSLNADTETLKSIDFWVGSLREALGNEVDIAIDLNFNFKTEGYIKIGKILEQYNLMWLEIDSYDPKALRQIKDSINVPITSCENLYGLRQYKNYFENHAMDIASIDVIWNGFTESKKIADVADSYEMNICPHNYNGHLSTFISLQLCAITPNLRMAEIDVDDVPWRDDLFTNVPEIVDGNMILADHPGWGSDINEKVAKKYIWNN
jgi:galactonate dehydratase